MQTIQLSGEQIKTKLKKAEADIKKNRVHSIEDVKKELFRKIKASTMTMQTTET